MGISRAAMAVAIMGLCGPRSASAANLTVRVCDTAQVPEDTLGSATAIDRQIFGQAGIGTDWLVQCSGTGSADLTVVIARGHPKAPAPPDALGVIWWARGEGQPNRAIVYFGSIAEKTTTRTETATLLANVIAHEVGHLLMGPQHSAKGLMSGWWGKATVREAMRAPLEVDRADRVRLRDSVRARRAEALSYTGAGWGNPSQVLYAGSIPNSGRG